ncbi:MAG: 16S rRNA (guanine(527)-N(7))-methyltransferase RsmG [Muribaculaceae bacterium]|nr:16S rRNA (guanine(527)-N(7))-methyltransferase RsmG [Muribaculaceae bacterium]
MESILKYFTSLTERQRQQFAQLSELYTDWNAKVNVISRKDIDNLYLKHVLHSLAIAAFMGELAEGTTMLDMGTGGGFPGIPLAIAYPQCRFHLIDRIGKKINVAREIASSVGLDNVTFQHGDIGECRERYDYVVSRAVMPLNGLVPLIVKNVKRQQNPANCYSPGLVCLKGGDLTEESKGVKYPVLEFPINEFFNEDFFDTKKIVYVPISF